MIQVNNVTRRYGAVTAVNAVSFNIAPGEIVGFLGPNGSGKTTLLRVIATYLLPSQGTVHVGGIDVTENPMEVLKLIGYLPESNILYPQMRVREYLTFVGRARGLAGARLAERLSWCVEIMKLNDVTDKRNSQCSKGYKQRISLAAALIHDPRYIILDEPTIGLDPLQVFMVRDFLRILARDRVVLFSSHSMQEVASMSRRVLIINMGKLIGDITFDEHDNRTERLEQIFVDAIRAHEQEAAG